MCAEPLVVDAGIQERKGGGVGQKLRTQGKQRIFLVGKKDETLI